MNIYYHLFLNLKIKNKRKFSFSTAQTEKNLVKLFDEFVISQQDLFCPRLCSQNHLLCFEKLKSTAKLHMIVETVIEILQIDYNWLCLEGQIFYCLL